MARLPNRLIGTNTTALRRPLVEREGIAAFDAVPLEGLQEELRNPLSHVNSLLHSKRALHTMLASDAAWIRTGMTTLTIRNVDPALKEELRVRAARHGRSMEAELRHILKEALGGEKQRAEPNLAEAIRRRFLPLGGADELEPHPPVPMRDPPRFDQ